MPGDALEAAALAYLDAWAPHIEHDVEAASTLEALRAAGIRTAMLSNTHWPREYHERFLERDGLAHLLDARVYTCELDYMKPHPAAFEAALAAVGVSDPARAVFVGDRPWDDIFGAQRAGLRTALRTNPLVPPYDVAPDVEIGRAAGAARAPRPGHVGRRRLAQAPPLPSRCRVSGRRRGRGHRQDSRTALHLTAAAQPFSLNQEWLKAQAFRWTEHDDGWCYGFVSGHLIKVKQSEGGIEFHSEAPEESLAPRVRDYFRLDQDIAAVHDALRDLGGPMPGLVKKYEGLQVLRQDPWGCLVAYICSATARVERIKDNVDKLATCYGEPKTLGDVTYHSFPPPERLVEAGEGELQSLGFGLNKGHRIYKAAKAIIDGELDLAALADAPLPGGRQGADDLARRRPQDRRLRLPLRARQVQGVPRRRAHSTGTTEALSRVRRHPAERRDAVCVGAR